MSLAKISVEGMRTIVSGLESGIETVTDAKTSLQTRLSTYSVYSARVYAIMPAARWAEDQLPGVKRRLALAEALENTNPAWPVGTVELDESDISTVDPDTAQQDGRDAAQALKDADGVPDAALVAQIVANQNDPYFAAGLAAELSPEELAELVVGLSYQRVGTDSNRTYDEMQAANAWYAELLTGLSGTLATATRSTGDLALPADYAEQWVNEITAEVPGQGDGDGEGRYDHANALAVLLSQGRFGTPFLNTVAEDVYEYERAFAEEFGGPVWGPRSGPETSLDPFVDAEGRPFRDPLAGIMSALGHNPEAAQHFFDNGETTKVEIQGSELEVSDRLKYLIQDRTWDVDPTNGASLGSALEAATTTFRDRTSDGRVSAEIASQTIALIGEQTGTGSDDGLRDFGPWSDQGWEMYDGLRPHVANILASYGADLHRVVSGDGDDLGDEGWGNLGSGVQFPDDMPYGLTLDKEHLEKIVGTLGQDQDNLTPLLAGVMQANNLALSTGLERGLETLGPEGAAAFLSGSAIDFASPSVTSSSEVLGWVLDAAYGGDAADEAAQKKRMEAVADALSLTSTLPFIPEIKPAWVKWGADQVKSRALEAYKGSAPSDAGSTYAELDASAQGDLTDTTMNLLLQNGYFSPEVIAVTDPALIPPPADAIVVSPTGEPLRFDTESRAYRDWYANSALKTIMAESVIGVYTDQWDVVK